MSTQIIHPNPAPLRQLVEVNAPEDFRVLGESVSATAGLAAAAASPPEVVFVSFDLADAAGRDLIEHLVAGGSEVVAVSEWATFAYDALRAGAVGFLLEPVRVVDFLEVLPRLRARVLEKKILAAANPSSK